MNINLAVASVIFTGQMPFLSVSQPELPKMKGSDMLHLMNFYSGIQTNLDAFWCCSYLC